VGIETENERILAHNFFLRQGLYQLVQLLSRAGQQAADSRMTLLQQMLPLLVDQGRGRLTVIPLLREFVA